MIDTPPTETSLLLASIGVLGLATAAIRIGPLFLPARSRLRRALDDPRKPLSALGPAVIGALAGSTFASAGREAMAGAATPFLVAVAATIVCLGLSRNIGLAVVVGVATHALTAAIA